MVRKELTPDSTFADWLIDYEKRGFVVDARLSHFAIGWDLSRRIQNGAL